MSNENLAPRDAKIISAILRSLDINECDPMVIIQLLEFAYKYCADIFKDAQLYAKQCERGNITAKDMKLSLQTRVGRYSVPAPPRSFLKSSAEAANSKEMSLPDKENLMRTPNEANGNFGAEYSIKRAKN